jgi:SagB-type dehydrogenase family enzyme
MEARRDAQVANFWRDWLPHGAFHFATKNVRFLSGRSAKHLLAGYLKESRQPLFFKNYRQALQFKLPPQNAPRGEFLRVLTSRETHREFSSASMPLEALSDLLYYTWGVTGSVESPIFGRLPRKTSPSGGARHPVEVYLAALRVADLRPGLYHYAPGRHCLELIRAGDFRKKCMEFCANQNFVQRAAALFIMTAVFRRAMWKYRGARAYRVVLLDAGHLCQTFCLTATWLGLAPFCTAALKDTLIETELGLDGITESVLYVAGVGLPKTKQKVSAPTPTPSWPRDKAPALGLGRPSS